MLALFDRRGAVLTVALLLLGTCTLAWFIRPILERNRLLGHFVTAAVVVLALLLLLGYLRKID